VEVRRMPSFEQGWAARRPRVAVAGIPADGGGGDAPDLIFDDS
jgi:hypothetical protein